MSARRESCRPGRSADGFTPSEPSPTVWFINHYASDPRQTSTGVRHFNISKELVRLGWTAVVLASDVAHPAGRRMFSSARRTHDAEHEGVFLRWRFTPTYANAPLRLVNMAWFTISLLLPGATRGLPAPDVIVGSTVHPFAAWSASVLARRHHVPFIFEIRDLWPETFVSMGKMRRSNPVAKALYMIEALLVRRSAVVVTTMPRADLYISEIGYPDKRVEWITNGISPEELPCQNLLPHDNVLVTYFGSMGTANALHLLLEGFAQATRTTSNLRLRLVGGGPLKDSLIQRATELGISSLVTFEPPVPRGQIAAIAAEADILALSLLPLSVYRYGTSLNKFFEYLAANRPVLFAGTTAANPAADIEGVITVDPSPEAISAGLRRLSALEPHQRADLASANRQVAIEKFSFAVLGGKYSELLKDVIRPLDPERGGEGVPFPAGDRLLPPHMGGRW